MSVVAEAKPLWQSRTVWFNFAAGLIQWLAMHAEAGTLPAVLAPYGPWIIILGNIFFRLVTNSPVKLNLFGADKAAVVLLAMGCATAFADPPKAVITGPTTAQAGEFLSLSASDSTATHYRWRVFPEMSGRKTHEVSADGKTIKLATLPGVQWRVILLVSNEEGPDMAEHLVRIAECATPPGPQPTPNPNPQPPAPGPTPPPAPVPPQPSPGRFGLAAKVVQWSASVNSPNKLATAKALADACESTAASVRAGVLTDPQAVLDAARAAIALAMEGEASAWGRFSAAFSMEVGILYATGRVSTAADIADVLTETAEGLRAIR